MAQVYVDLIMKGLKAVDDVPSRLRSQVEQLLAEATEGDGKEEL